MSTCLYASVVYVPTCVCASTVYVPTCLRANVLNACQRLNFAYHCAHKRVNVPYDVPMFERGMKMCQTACQFFNSACQRAKWCPNFPNIPLTKCFGKFLLLIHYYYTKSYTLYLISQLYISHVYIKIVLYFISILHVILKKSMWNVSFTLQVTTFFSNFLHLKQLSKRKTTCEYCDLLEL